MSPSSRTTAIVVDSFLHLARFLVERTGHLEVNRILEVRDFDGISSFGCSVGREGTYPPSALRRSCKYFISTLSSGGV